MRFEPLSFTKTQPRTQLPLEATTQMKAKEHIIEALQQKDNGTATAHMQLQIEIPIRKTERIGSGSEVKNFL